MPFLELPERGNLRMYYAVNPIFDPKTGSVTNDSNPIDPAKPSLVLLHGPLSSLAAFSAQFSDVRLAKAFNLIGFDSRLHGLTKGDPRPKGKHTIENSADCLVAALDFLELSSYAIVGESIKGCNEATWIALKRPEKVRALCLVSPSWHTSPQAVSDSMINDFLPMFISNKDGRGDGTGSLPEPSIKIVAEARIVELFSAQTWRSDVGTILSFWPGHNELINSTVTDGTGHSSHDAEHVIRWFDRQRIPADRLATVKQPVLILAGTADTQVSPLTAAEEWRDSFTSAAGGADLRTISGGPHLALYTDYSVANRFLLAFVTRNYGAI
ncbi:hypothetical protein P7C70_g1953, partial [Phenoliferia sp. Uapishka_3]